jgi:hypothetical protein
MSGLCSSSRRGGKLLMSSAALFSRLIQQTYRYVRKSRRQSLNMRVHGAHPRSLLLDFGPKSRRLGHYSAVLLRTHLDVRSALEMYKTAEMCSNRDTINSQQSRLSRFLTAKHQ